MANCIPDLEIGQQISSILHRDVRINDDGIHVCVQDGWVFLDGKVDFEDERDLVESRIESVAGVCRITNNLTYPARYVREIL